MQSHDMRELDALAGKALFERTWVTAPASTASADGLGPYYDARSCAACHPAAGNGAVPATLTVVLDDAIYGKQLQRHAAPGLPAEAIINFSVDDVAVHGQTLQRISATFDALQFGPPGSAFSLRRPPALAGIARFDEVSDETLRLLADPEDRNGDGISGRVAGRYGWKGETASLAQQVSKAFSIDLGISNALFPANSADCTAVQQQCLEHAGNASTGSGVEADQLVLDLVTLYLASMPEPAMPEADPAGQAVFNELGCADCHLPELPTAGSALQAWTDLLLHDMGPELAAGPGASAAEWRTAPLWSLAQSQAYLHDGRARSIEEAIDWHGGEAAASRQKFANAGEDQRQRLQAFLLGL